MENLGTEEIEPNAQSGHLAFKDDRYALVIDEIHELEKPLL